MNHFGPAVALTASLLFPIATALAAEPEEIIITADPLGGTDAHLATPAAILSRDDLRRGNDRNVGEAIAQSLGASVADFGQNVGRPILRGLGGARVRVLENGIGTMDVSTLGADHAVAVDTVFAEQIEIFRGPATLLYGSGASGGFVNVVNEHLPTEVPDTFTGELRGGYDSAADGVIGGLRASGGIGEGLAFHVEYARQDRGEYRIPGFGPITPDAQDPKGKVEHSDAASESSSAGIAWHGERGMLGVAVSGLDSAYGIPGEHHHHGSPASDDEGTRIEQRQTRFDLRAAWHPDTALLREVNLRAGINDHRLDEIEDGALGTRLDNDEWEGRVELLHGAFGPWDGVAGMQIQDRDFLPGGDEILLPQAEHHAIAGFLFEKADLGRLHADFGVRHEASTARTLTDRAEFDVWSLSGGLTYGYREQGAISTSLTYAERAPALEELYARGPHLASRSFELGDPGLRPEQAVNIELSLHEHFGPFTLQVNGFHNAIDDFVYLREQDRDGDGLADRVEPDYLETELLASDDDALLLLHQTQRNARFWGYEAELISTHELAGGRLHARLWTDYVRGRLQGGERLPRLTPRRLGFELGYERDRLTADLSVTRTFAKDAVAALETPTGGYTMIDVGAGYTFDPTGPVTWQVSLRASNLLDTEARRHTSLLKDEAPLPGRALRLGVSMLF